VKQLVDRYFFNIRPLEELEEILKKKSPDEVIKYLGNKKLKFRSSSNVTYNPVMAATIICCGNRERNNEALIDKFKSLLEKFSEHINVQSSAGTPLHLAVINGKLGIVNALIEKGPNLDLQDLQGNTPLHIAVKEGKLDIVNALIERCASLNVRSSFMDTPLHLAVRSENLSVCGALIAEGVRDLSNIAVEKRRLDIVKALINGGADLNTPSSFNDTPLHIAVKEGKLDIVNALIEKGANLDLQDQQGNTPLHLAAKSGNLGIVKALIDGGADLNVVSNALYGTPLHIAVRRNKEGDSNIVKALIKGGANLNLQDWQSNTPLHLAAINGNLEVFDALIKGRANLNVQNERGDTPLHLAAKSGNLRIVESLINKGAADTLIRNNEHIRVYIGPTGDPSCDYDYEEVNRTFLECCAESIKPQVEELYNKRRADVVLGLERDGRLIGHVMGNILEYAGLSTTETEPNPAVVAAAAQPQQQQPQPQAALGVNN